MDSGTICIPGQVCLLSRCSLVLTCVACSEIEEQLYSFRAPGRLRPRSCLSGKPLVFQQRYAFQVLQVRSQCLHPGNYRAFSLIQSSIITTLFTKISQIVTERLRILQKKIQFFQSILNIWKIHCTKAGPCTVPDTSVQVS